MAVKMETEVTTLPAQERKPQETIDSSSRGDIPLRWLTSILLLIFPTATLFLNRGDSYVLGILTLVGVWVWLRDGARRWLDRPAALLWIAFVLFFAIALLSYLLGTQTDAGFRFLGRYLRFLLIVPVYLALRRYPPTAQTAFIGLALGALLAGVIGGLHIYRLDAMIRIEATTGVPIIFGDLVTTMTLCVVAGLGLLAASHRKWIAPLLALCAAGGTAATLLSGTRGAWIPLLLLPPTLMTQFRGFLKTRYVFATVLILVAVFAVFYVVPGSGTQERITDAGRSFRNYFVALPYIDTHHEGSHGDPLCRGNPDFLRAWLDSGRTWLGGLDAAVVADPNVNHAFGCRTDYVVRLHNPSSEQVAQRFFLRIPNQSTAGQHTVMLMRGAGTMYFRSGRGKPTTHINTREYRLYSLVDHKTQGSHVNLSVAPGRTIWLLPFDSFPGEYSLSIADTSVGHRLELWRSAWIIFLQHPVFGAGFGSFQEKVDDLIQQGRVARFVQDYDHPHNDYLNALSSSGIVGLVILLGILVVPAWHYSRSMRCGSRALRAISMAGLFTVMGFAIYALTDTIFLHSMMITWYVVYMALFYALLDAQARKLAKPESPKQ